LLSLPTNENTLYYFIRSPSEDNVSKSIRPKYQLIVPKFKLPEFLDMTNALPQQVEPLSSFLRRVI